MMSATSTFQTVVCSCSCIYAVETVFFNTRAREGEAFYCPACGEENHFAPDETPEEKRKAESETVVSLKRQLAQALHNWEQCEAKVEELAGKPIRGNGKLKKEKKTADLEK